MSDIMVTIAFLLLPFVNWPVAILLLRLSLKRPKIRSLAERAFLAFLIALVTTVYSLIVLNTSLDYPVLTRDSSRDIVRVFIFIVGLYPLWWLWAYWTDRFRD